MDIFKCKHPVKYLFISKGQTESMSEDGLFKEIENHLYCIKCGENIIIKAAETTSKFWEFKEEI